MVRLEVKQTFVSSPRLAYRVYRDAKEIRELIKNKEKVKKKEEKDYLKGIAPKVKENLKNIIAILKQEVEFLFDIIKYEEALSLREINDSEKLRDELSKASKNIDKLDMDPKIKEEIKDSIKKYENALSKVLEDVKKDEYTKKQEIRDLYRERERLVRYFTMYGEIGMSNIIRRTARKERKVIKKESADLGEAIEFLKKEKFADVKKYHDIISRFLEEENVEEKEIMKIEHYAIILTYHIMQELEPLKKEIEKLLPEGFPKADYDEIVNDYNNLYNYYNNRMIHLYRDVKSVRRQAA